MNRKLFLSLALLVLISNAQGNMECFSGQKIVGFPMSGMPLPTPQSITCNDDQTCMVFKMRVRMEVQGINIPEMMMEIGSCIDPSACSKAKCDRVKREAAASMANMSMSIVQCKKTCNEPASAGATPAQMPILPNIGGGVPAQMPVLPGGGVPEQMPVLPEGGAFPAQMPVLEGNGRVCNPAMWGNMEVRDNKILENSRPHFILKVAKAERRGYKPRRPYRIIIRATKPKKLNITGFEATLHSVNSSSCPLGKFLGSSLPIASAPEVDTGCDQPLIMGLRPSRVEVKKSSDAKWLAPRCKQPGLVMIKVVVRGSDNRLYRDNEMMGSEHWELTKILRPKLKKKKPRRPHHNGGRRRKNRRREQN